jgi:hypothetical protein
MPVDPHVPGAFPATRSQVPATSLQCGMYVTELDRPWLDTPFLLQDSGSAPRVGSTRCAVTAVRLRRHAALRCWPGRSDPQR